MENRNLLVNDIIMPVLGILTGGINLTEAKWMIREAVSETQPELTLNYGQFLQNIVDFLIISFSIFLAIRLINRFNKKDEEEKKKCSSGAPADQGRAFAY